MSDSDSEHEKKPKKDKKDKKSKKRVRNSSSEEVEDRTVVKKSKGSAANTSSGRMKNEDGDEMIELGKMKYVTVRSYRGQTFVDIREYYTDKGTGAMKPGKKGIALSKEQFNHLKEVFGEIEEKLNAT